VFKGEKTAVFWIGLVILGFSSVGLFTAVWHYAMNPSPWYFEWNVPYIVGAVVFALIGLYMMKSGVKRKPE